MSGRLWVGRCLLVAGLVAMSSVAAADPLDKPAFTATPSELLAAARAAQANAAQEAKAGADPDDDDDGNVDRGILVLRWQRDVRFDERGRKTVRKYVMYAIRTSEAIASWGTLETGWYSAYQDRPAIRARVIDPSGQVSELDPAQAEEKRASRIRGRGGQDALEAAMPPLSIGAVVEQEITTVDRDPQLGGAMDITWLNTLGSDHPHTISYTIPAVLAGGAQARKLRHVERDLPRGVRVRHDLTGGNERWIYDVPAHLPFASLESEMPEDARRDPYIGVAAAADWQTIARQYAKAVDHAITSGPVALPADVPHTPTVEAAAAITQWVHRQVRAANRELGELGLAPPHSPADTLKFLMDDRDSVAVLLVALLRQAGIRADVAAIARRYGRFAPELPSLDQFNHIVVRAQIGARELWLDPMAEYLRPGELRPFDQGRHALILAADSRGPLTTPAATAAENRIRVVRTYTLAEHGSGQLTEVIQPSGAFDWLYRSRFSDAQANNSKAARERAKARFAGTLDQVTTTSVDDLSKPFEITQTVKDIRTAFAGYDAATVNISPRQLIEEAPWTVQGKGAAKRTQPFLWDRPYSYELEARIAVPPGFDLPAPEPEQRRALGSAAFIQRRRIDGQTVIVTLRFESGKPRLSAGELTELRGALQSLADEQIAVTIENTADALNRAGKSREAIAECNRLIALHPKEALHHNELARYLIIDGAGEAARREAREAARLEPTNAGTLTNLGWVLTYDSVGRQYMVDWDRAGALAVLQKARQLEPNHLGALIELARVLQRDPQGRMLEAGADLPGAAEAWRAAEAIQHTDENANQLSGVLAAMGQFAEAEKLSRTTAQTTERDRWIVALAAARGGPAAARGVADELGGSTGSRAMLESAAIHLLALRRYDAARKLYADIGFPANLPPLISGALDHLVVASPPRSPADPRTGVLEMMHASMDPGYKTNAFWDAATERSLRTETEAYMPKDVARLRLRSIGFVWDLTQAAVDIQIDGDAGLWRATGKVDGAWFAAYLALDHGVAKVIGTLEDPTGVGRFILRGGARTDARARRLLDWVFSDIDRGKLGRGQMIKPLWDPAAPPASVTHASIQLMAAAMAAETDPQRSIPILEQCDTASPEGELVCHMTLSTVYWIGHRWDDAVPQLDEVARRKPATVPWVREFKAKALVFAGRVAEADHVFDEVLAATPDDYEALSGRYDVAVYAGEIDEAKKRAEALLRHPRVTSQMVNSIAWNQISYGGDLTAALDQSLRSLVMKPSSESSRNTLAALEALTGKVSSAIETNHKAMESRTLQPPNDGDWYVFGLIYEQLGLTTDAVAAYRRVTKPSVELSSVYAYAQKRLAQLPH